MDHRKSGKGRIILGKCMIGLSCLMILTCLIIFFLGLTGQLEGADSVLDHIGMVIMALIMGAGFVGFAYLGFKMMKSGKRMSKPVQETPKTKSEKTVEEKKKNPILSEAEKIPPVKRKVATQTGQQMLFDYASVLLPALKECKTAPHASSRLFTERIDDVEALLDVMPGVLEEVAGVIDRVDLAFLTETLWQGLNKKDLLKGWKSFRCYESLAVGNNNFAFFRELIEERLNLVS